MSFQSLENYWLGDRLTQSKELAIAQWLDPKEKKTASEYRLLKESLGYACSDTDVIDISVLPEIYQKAAHLIAERSAFFLQTQF